MWTCTACTFENKASSLLCEICSEAKRPAIVETDRRKALDLTEKERLAGANDAKSEGMAAACSVRWICASCTFENEAGAKECDVCGEVKRQTTVVAVEISKDKTTPSATARVSPLRLRPISSAAGGRDGAEVPPPQLPDYTLKTLFFFIDSSNFKKFIDLRTIDPPELFKTMKCGCMQAPKDIYKMSCGSVVPTGFNAETGEFELPFDFWEEKIIGHSSMEMGDNWVVRKEIIPKRAPESMVDDCIIAHIYEILNTNEGRENGVIVLVTGDGNNENETVSFKNTVLAILKNYPKWTVHLWSWRDRINKDYVTLAGRPSLQGRFFVNCFDDFPLVSSRLPRADSTERDRDRGGKNSKCTACHCIVKPEDQWENHNKTCKGRSLPLDERKPDSKLFPTEDARPKKLESTANEKRCLFCNGMVKSEDQWEIHRKTCRGRCRQCGSMVPTEDQWEGHSMTCSAAKKGGGVK